MTPENVPIIINLPTVEQVEIYPIHDLHYGNELFDAHKWNELSKLILSEPNRYVIWVGDLMENTVQSSKGDIYTQTASPREQREFVESLFRQFSKRTLAIVDGNHEYNRSTRYAGLYPLYDAACLARIEDKYRSAYAVVDLGIGEPERLSRAVGFVSHRAKDMKSFASVDCLEGFTYLFCGHDHDPHEHPRAHLVYDRQRREVSVKSVEQIDSGSFLRYGGYAVRAGMRPQSDKMYKLVLRAQRYRQVSVETVGFYV